MEGHRTSTLVLLFVGLFGFFGLFAHGYLENPDVDATMHGARALYLRGDSGLDAEAPDASPAEKALVDYITTTGQYGMVGRNGKHYVWFPIGHLYLMLPSVAAGELLAKLFPQPERILESEDRKGPVWGQFFWIRLLISLTAPAFAAGSAVLLFLLARTLALSTALALLVLMVTTLCTQFWPGSTESLSDGPGMFFLLGSVLGVFRYHLGKGQGVCLLLAGLSAGLAVLVRYPHAMLVPVLVGSVVVSARERRPTLHPVLFCLGGLPCLLWLGAVDFMRFGSVFETGYGNASLAGWFAYPPYIGAFKILFAAGKGIMWFSPMLWIALPQILRLRGHLMVMTWLLFLIPFCAYSNTQGWQSGTCWSIRYLTPSVALMVVVSLSLGRPWERHPRVFGFLAVAGLLISMSGHVAPFRGHQQMAHEAAKTVYADQLMSGDLQEGDLPEHFFFEPRYTPIRSNWIYAWLAVSGRMEEGGSANTTEPLFGVAVEEGEFPLRPANWEERGFRHLWPFYLQALVGGAAWILALVWAAATGWILFLVLRRLPAQDPHTMGR